MKSIYSIIKEYVFETSYLFVRNETELTIIVLTHLPSSNEKTGDYRSIRVWTGKVWICANLCVIINRIRIARVELSTQKPPLFFRISYGFSRRCLDSLIFPVFSLCRRRRHTAATVPAAAVDADADAAAACFPANGRPTERARAPV